MKQVFLFLFVTSSLLFSPRAFQYLVYLSIHNNPDRDCLLAPPSLPMEVLSPSVCASHTHLAPLTVQVLQILTISVEGPSPLNSLRFIRIAPGEPKAQYSVPDMGCSKGG